MINYEERMKELIGRSNELQEEIDNLESQRDVEIKEAIAQINKKYDEKQILNANAISLARNEIVHINDKVKQASRFKVDDILAVMADIVSKIENEEFTYLEMKLDNVPFYVIRPVDGKKITDDNTIVFGERVVENGSIGFYANNFYDYPSLLVDFKRFTYLKDFIDSVVKYRLDKSYDIEEITLDELESLMEEFLKPDNVRNNSKVNARI